MKTPDLPQFYCFTETQKSGARIIPMEDYLIEPFFCDKILQQDNDIQLEFDEAIQQILTVVEHHNLMSYQYSLNGVGEVVKVTIDSSGIVENNPKYMTKTQNKICFVVNLDEEHMNLSVYSGIEEDRNISLQKGQIVMFPAFYCWETTNENPKSFVLGNFVGEAFR